MADLIPTNFTEVAIYVLLFSAYFMVMELIFLSLDRRATGRATLTRRLDVRQSLTGDGQASTGYRSQPALVQSDQFTGPLAPLARLYRESGLDWRAWQVAIVVAAQSALCSVLAYLIFKNVFVVAFVAVVATVVFPLALLLFKRANRLRKFEGQLPDALDSMVRSIKAGHPIPTSIQMVVREFSEPIGTEFAKVSDEMTYGLDLETAMRNLNSRVRQHDLSLVVSAISIHTKSGGHLSEILGNLASVVRHRIRMRMKVRALSAEGRLSAIVLSILPFVLFGILSFTAPDYYGQVWKHNIVYPIFIAAGVWMAIGNFIMWHMVNFEI